MPAVEATRNDHDKGVLFQWKPMQQASAWFVQSMGMRDAGKADGGEMEMVYWTSSELPDMGMGLVNYQPNSAISKWQKEKVLLPAAATECMAPKEAVGAMSMSRVIASGLDFLVFGLNLVHRVRFELFGVDVHAYEHAPGCEDRGRGHADGGRMQQEFRAPMHELEDADQAFDRQ